MRIQFTAVLLLELLIFVFISGCAVKISKVAIKTENQQVHAIIYLSNNYKDCPICSTGISKETIEWAENLCSKYGIEHEVEINDDTTEVKINLEINGFDRVNALASDLENATSGLSIRVIQGKKYASVFIRLDPSNFLDNAEFLIESSNEILSVVPGFSNNNLKFIKRSDDLIRYKIHNDTSRGGNTFQEITYSYITTIEPGQEEQKKKIKWSWNDFGTWERIGIILGIVVSMMAIVAGIRKLWLFLKSYL